MKSLLSQQADAKMHLSAWKVGALFMEAGTGKTRVALEIVNQSPCDGVVWVGPLRTIENTKGEIRKWGGFKMQSYYYGIESIQSSDRKYFDLLSTVQSFKNPFVVVDESLKMKNTEAKRTKRMLEVGKKVRYKLILNGTPLSKNLLDLWPQMEFLSPMILGMTANQFKSNFCCYTKITKSIGTRHYTKEFVTGYENIDYLYSLIRHYVFKCDLSLNISQCYHTFKYSISDENRREYNRIKERYLSDEVLEWKDNNIFMEMTQKMQHSYCVDDGKFTKMEELFKTIDKRKTIIFCKYIDSQTECRRRYPDACVLSYQKESLGLNLQEYHYTIYFDKTWDYATRIQACRRTFRTGQENDCEYFDLTGDVGLESIIDRNIAKKVSMTEYFKSKTKEQLREEL